MNNKESNKTLFQRYLDDLYTMEDARQVLKDIPDSDNHEILNELSSDIWEESGSQQPSTDIEHKQYKREAHQLLMRIEHKKKSWFQRIAIATASVAAVICIVISGIQYLETIHEQEINYLDASTSYGERKEVLLPDGTQLILNSCSHIRYPEKFMGEERTIELVGEGYFKVYRNEEQPFIIKTPRFNVRVLGTCFNIKSYSSDEIVSVDVESGKVQVDLPEAMMRLHANEQIVINTISGEYSKRLEDHPVAIWKKGGLRFNNTPIRDVAKELERIYNCHITFAEGQFNNLISGEHENESLEAVLQSIKYTSGIRYKKKGNDILLYK